MSRPRVFSGIQPTADSFHIGNYLGAVRQWVALMLVSDIAESANEDQLSTTMARAKLCQTVAERIRAASLPFILEPRVRYAGQPGEQATMFLLDLSGNALEFKSFKHPEHVFTA